jgi:hypothetical protein
VTATHPDNVVDHGILHFTHIRNLAGILAHGGLKSDSSVDRSQSLQVEAADLDIKASRRVIPIPRAPFGCVGDYVPFYFAPRSPMLYKLSKGSVPNYQDGQAPLIYLVSSVLKVLEVGRPCLFSDGNCAHSVTEIFDDLTLLDAAVDWDVMRGRMWNNTAEDPDRMRRRMAEFLVHDNVPIGCVAEIGVLTQPVKIQVERELAARSTRIPVRVRAGWYF